MSPQIGELVEKIRQLESELEVELARRREELRFELIGRKVRFEQEIRQRHKTLKIGLLRYLAQARLRNVITAPAIYAMIFPLLLLDLFVTLYQLTCFPLYSIPKVKRCDYLIFDHHKLAYLNAIEKLNCAYCSYGNGLLSYIKEIVARTEQYWCPIKHAQRVLQAHSRYSRFTDFGDAEAYHHEREKLRCDFGSQEEKP